MGGRARRSKTTPVNNTHAAEEKLSSLSAKSVQSQRSPLSCEETNKPSEQRSKKTQQKNTHTVRKSFSNARGHSLARDQLPACAHVPVLPSVPLQRFGRTNTHVDPRKPNTVGCCTCASVSCAVKPSAVEPCSRCKPRRRSSSQKTCQLSLQSRRWICQLRPGHKLTD